jgi:photosystem II stability/assembly factor-like uncharacterized protein
VTLLSSTDGWAVGDNGTILNFDGTSWNADPASGVVTANNLHAVAFDSTTDGFAVGENGTILHFSSGNWTVATVIPPDSGDIFEGVSAVSSTNAWVVTSGGLIYHSTNGTTWSKFASFSGDSFQSIAMVSSGHDGWIVGPNLGSDP